MKEARIFAFCGIGNPDAYLKNLEKLQLNVVGHKIFNDHHDYTSQNMSEIYEEAKYLNATVVLSTEKDWVKTALLVKQKDDIVFAYLALKLGFIEAQQELTNLIDNTICTAKAR